MSNSSTYTFGDNPTAAQRLQLLSDLFRPALDAFVREHVRTRPKHLVDLGCGPGHSTRVLAALLHPERITGMDSSERFIEEARLTSPLSHRFLVHDLTTPLPQHAEHFPADVLYSRFLLTHVAQPDAALSTWVEYVEPGGLVLAQETAAMETAHPVLARYYELVAELQHRHGQRLDIGQSLADLVDRSLYDVQDAGIRRFTLPGASMARLHALNLPNWRRDPQAASLDSQELDELHDALMHLAEGPSRAAEVDYSMGELALRRR